MLQITYSKGIYTLTDGVKTYTFNINNGHLINTKTNRRVMQPAFLKQEILQALHPIYMKNGFSPYANMLTVLYRRLDLLSMKETFYPDAKTVAFLSALDKLFNVMPKGYVLLNPQQITELSNKQLVKVINFVREYTNINDNHINLRYVIQRLQLEELAVTCGNIPIEFVEKYEYFLKRLFENISKEYRDIAFYYFYHQKLYALRTDTDDSCSYHYGERYIQTYIKCCQAMKKQPVKTNNFMREYIETLTAYDIWRETSKNERFLSHYERYKNNLTFSYGNYAVVLPENIQDLVTEGNEMHHCVGGYRDKVANGESLIIFIRHKNTPDKCYITAEISPTNGRILQYYLAYDRHISTNEDYEFKEELQKWLRSCKW